MLGLLHSLHVLSVIIWVGGMFFAYMILRPVAASELEPPLRLNLWRHIFNHFFPWVWAIIFIIPVTGILLSTPFGDFLSSPLYILIMTVLGSAMVIVFLYLYFTPFRKIKICLDNNDLPAAALQLNLIRKLVGTNTIIGIATVLVATAGKFI